MTLADLRRYAVARSLFPPISLKAAVESLGFVQADPIRAPARAQDLTLRHRVRNYHAGDLERRYASLGIEEDFFINYGFVSSELHALMHPRSGSSAWHKTRRDRAAQVLDFVRARGEVHPREVDAHFSHGRVTNYWGGTSSATTHLLDHMHYRGLVRVTRREKGIRIYGAREPARDPGLTVRERVDRLVDFVVDKYAPLPAPSLSYVIARLRYAAPQWQRELKPARERARARLSHARVGGVDWYWPTDETPGETAPDDRVRLLAPFDPIVWDRRRFELLWGWAYRFEAYTPVAKRKLGYYALPLLWRDGVMGWANVSVVGGQMQADVRFVAGHRPRSRVFTQELDAELDRMRAFLRVGQT
jgi:uncharacterized protein YcaQ